MKVLRWLHAEEATGIQYLEVINNHNSVCCSICVLILTVCQLSTHPYSLTASGDHNLVRYDMCVCVCVTFDSFVAGPIISASSAQDHLH